MLHFIEMIDNGDSNDKEYYQLIQRINQQVHVISNKPDKEKEEHKKVKVKVKRKKKATKQKATTEVEHDKQEGDIIIKGEPLEVTATILSPCFSIFDLSPLEFARQLTL